MTKSPFRLEELIPHQEFFDRELHPAVAIDNENAYLIDDAVRADLISRKRKEYHISVHVSDAGLLYGQTQVIDAARERDWWIDLDADQDTDAAAIADKRSKMLLILNMKAQLSLRNKGAEGAPSVMVSFDFKRQSREIGNISIKKARVDATLYTFREHAKNKNSQARKLDSVAETINQPKDRIASLSSTSSQSTVAEILVATNKVVAREIEELELPWIFKNFQEPDAAEKKAQARSAYSAVAIGNDSLNGKAYCHFTSPLQKFTDLANHLNLHAYLQGLEIPFSHEEMAEIARERNEARTRAYRRKRKQRFQAASIDQAKISA